MLFYAGILTVSNVFNISPIGSVVSLVAWILAAKAFLSITVPAAQAFQVSMAPAAQVKYCPVCGATNVMDAEYCVRCGKKL
jgi:ribosomal protein L40E